jgi:hypothetical protein
MRPILFAAFPDYRNIFDRLVVQAGSVVVLGRSSCSEARLDGPALWVAKVSDGKIAEWHVYDDTPTLRRTLGVGWDRDDPGEIDRIVPSWTLGGSRTGASLHPRSSPARGTAAPI